ncbi:unnamed protein product [Lupinus luteus]|uniref:Disease resistance protein At4g27190-like leucine-rich repeats domain-containing protein n=1 Tax=Lupinus luteus TaxID=3873 RepID=A0AAV1Y2T5_LUPLU
MNNIHGDNSNNNKGKLISRYLCGFLNHTVTVDDEIEKQHKSVVAVENAETPGLESLHSQHFIHFKRRKLIYKQLLEAMEHNYMTGLHGIEGIGKTALAKQVFSHDTLNIEKAKRLSILLSMFPLDREVPIEMLTRLAIGAGLFSEVEKYSQVRSEVLKLKDILIESYVCSEYDRGHVKMNEPIWNMIREGDLSLLEIKYYRSKWILFTIEKNIHYLYFDDLSVEEMVLDLIPSSYGYDGNKVELLLIDVEANNSLEVPNAFFEKMTRLQVLSVSSKNIHRSHVLKLPSSLQLLTNIRSLILSHWKLCDISILGKLQSLHILDFDDCSIYEFPKEISTLKLRLLSLKNCEIEKNNPLEVIERCLSLQELYYKDNEVSKNIDSVDEAEEIHQSGTFPTLNKYYLQGGEDDSSISKCVCLPSIDAMVSKATFKYLIQGAEIVHLKEIHGEWKSLIPDIVSSMNDVVELSLESCSKVEYLINTELDQFLESLKKLSIEHCAHLQGIVLKSKVNLCNLKSVNIFDCQQLTSLFQLSTAENLLELEELRIRDCKLLTKIIEDENDHKSNALMFPKLETLEIECCERLECILPIDVMLLQNIKISKCPKLKNIFYEEGGDIKKSPLQKMELSNVSHLFISIECYTLLDSTVKKSSQRIAFNPEQKVSSKNHPHKSRASTRIKIPLILQGLNIQVVQNITQLVLKDVDKIKYLFTLITASSMMLEILVVDSCDKLKHIVDIENDSDRKKFEVVFQKLKEFSVTNCGQLEYMFGKSNAAKDDENCSEIYIHFPALKILNLQKLPKFSLSPITCTSLKEFVLLECPEFVMDHISDLIIHFDSRSLVIKDISEIDKHFHSLETLEIDGSQAKNIFCARGVNIIGQVKLGLQCLKLRNLDLQILTYLPEDEDMDMVEVEKELQRDLPSSQVSIKQSMQANREKI